MFNSKPKMSDPPDVTDAGREELFDEEALPSSPPMPMFYSPPPSPQKDLPLSPHHSEVGTCPDAELSVADVPLMQEIENEASSYPR